MNDFVKGIEQYFDADLPGTYRQFIEYSEKESYDDVVIYLAEDIIERNQCFETKEYAQGYINIGDDGGGQAFILLLNQTDPAVYAVDHGSMNPDERTLISPSFSSWHTASFALPRP